ncbi:MucR family transcriptional regulator [Geomonas anaerohicana]|uniref:MucR family transcriptional regulator n=1 Tax=Geomonas anaerohicana TaxID=2798583 RepID=A0ABS0YC82_9BACT|nr:MucR family transcriptional regulator [Geomonas anaerohicana]MBJ6749906.1 MucR family transcriptional regulator [Geomonas anaerohicana]
MTTLLEVVGRIVTAHLSRCSMTSEDVVAEINSVHATLSNLDKGASTKRTTPKGGAAVSRKQAFGKSQVVCMLCGKGGMRTLTRHLASNHSMKPAEYRKKFGIPKEQPLTASDFSAHRRALATARGLADHLVKARAVRAEKIRARRTSYEGLS